MFSLEKSIVRKLYIIDLKRHTFHYYMCKDAFSTRKEKKNQKGTGRSYLITIIDWLTVDFQ